MGELYGGAVWWSCILELYVKNIRYILTWLDLDRLQHEQHRLKDEQDRLLYK
jgi:hypothetical protein